MTSIQENKPIITILGSTATGKTALAANLAALLNAEIISADSRQVFRGMDIGTGKDLNEYNVNGIQVPYHLIDIANAGQEFNVHRFQSMFYEEYRKISALEKICILSGGSGLYIEAVLKAYRLIEVPEDFILRRTLSKLSQIELNDQLRNFRRIHNTTDTEDRDRTIRAIEIETYYKNNPEIVNKFPPIPSINFGISYERYELKQNITIRLQERLSNGMLEEVEGLLKSGLKPEDLDFYGLEYRFVTRYLTEDITYSEMFQQLNTAIHQFAKKQETWWRRMEKNGTYIHWVSGKLSLEQRIQFVLQKLNQMF